MCHINEHGQYNEMDRQKMEVYNDPKACYGGV